MPADRRFASAFGFSSVPVQASLPSGETYKSAAVATWPANARAMVMAEIERVASSSVPLDCHGVASRSVGVGVASCALSSCAPVPPAARPPRRSSGRRSPRRPRRALGPGGRPRGRRRDGPGPAALRAPLRASPLRPGRGRSASRRRARSSGLAVRKILHSAPGNATVPWSRPSVTTSRPPAMACCRATSCERISGLPAA